MLVEIVATVTGVLGVGLLAVVGWAVQLSNKVAVQESNFSSLEKLIDAKLRAFLDITDARFGAVIERLERIDHNTNGNTR